jgi:hypothetical protein
MKLIGVLLITTLLLSYLPVLTLHGCTGEDQVGTNQLNCGYLFHCPISLFKMPYESYSFPSFLNIFLEPTSRKVIGFRTPIFHPP